MRVRSIASILIVIVLGGALALNWSSSFAQDTGTATAVPPTPTATPSPTAYPLQGLRFGLLANVDLVADIEGPARVSAATLSIQPGQASLPFVSEGETIVVVTAGAITVEADEAAYRVVDSGSLIGLRAVGGTPGPVMDKQLGVGWQIHLLAGATLTIRNEGESAASVIVVTIVPERSAVDGTPTP